MLLLLAAHLHTPGLFRAHLACAGACAPVVGIAAVPRQHSYSTHALSTPQVQTSPLDASKADQGEPPAGTAARGTVGAAKVASPAANERIVFPADRRLGAVPAMVGPAKKVGHRDEGGPARAGRLCCKERQLLPCQLFSDDDMGLLVMRLRSLSANCGRHYVGGCQSLVPLMFKRIGFSHPDPCPMPNHCDPHPHGRASSSVCAISQKRSRSGVKATPEELAALPEDEFTRTYRCGPKGLLGVGAPHTPSRLLELAGWPALMPPDYHPVSLTACARCTVPSLQARRGPTRVRLGPAG